jgi:hypothetical protein
MSEEMHHRQYDAAHFRLLVGVPAIRIRLIYQNPARDGNSRNQGKHCDYKSYNLFSPASNNKPAPNGTGYTIGSLR